MEWVEGRAGISGVCGPEDDVFFCLFFAMNKLSYPSRTSLYVGHSLVTWLKECLLCPRRNSYTHLVRHGWGHKKVPKGLKRGFIRHFPLPTVLLSRPRQAEYVQL